MAIAKAYFDNASTTYVKPVEVHNFMHAFYEANSVNIGRGNHELLNDSKKIVSETRQMLLNLFCANSDYIAVFQPTATEALNVIIQGQELNAGQNIYISPFEHNAVYRTVKHLEKDKGIRVIELLVDKKTLAFQFDKINRQFADNKPALVIVSHVSNVCGNIAPINELGKLVKEYKAIYTIDCAQSAGLLETDIVKCRADYMVFAGHKTLYGAFGCSGFICKKTAKLKPLIFGGTGIDSKSAEMPTDLPMRFEAGSINILSIAGLHAALTWHKKTGKENIRKKEETLYNQLLQMLSDCNTVEIVGNTTTAVSIVSCIFKDFSPESVEQILSSNGIITRSGLQCAPIAHKLLGTYPAGTVRFSISYFTTQEELKQLLDVIQEFTKNM